MSGTGNDTRAGALATGRRQASALLAALGPMIGLVFVWLLFAGLNGASFVSWGNQRLMLLQTAVVGTAAVGATLIIISGGIDLSVGSSIAFGTMVVALVLDAGAPPLAAAAAGIAGGMACGAVIGSLVIGRAGRVSSIIVAVLLAAWLWRAVGAAPAIVAGLLALGLLPWALRGAAKGLGGNEPVYPPSAGWLGDLMSTSVGGIGAVLPPGVWVLLVLAVLMAGVLRYTRFGRHVFAIGSSAETARLCGVHVERTTFLVYVIGVGCAGLAAVLQFSYLSMGDPTTAEGYELKVIAAVVIGGASLSGGEGSIRGTVVGALIMTVVDNGCTKLGLDNWVQEIVTGAIIVAAVVLDRLRHRRLGGGT